MLTLSTMYYYHTNDDAIKTGSIVISFSTLLFTFIPSVCLLCLCSDVIPCDMCWTAFRHVDRSSTKIQKKRREDRRYTLKKLIIKCTVANMNIISNLNET